MEHILAQEPRHDRRQEIFRGIEIKLECMRTLRDSVAMYTKRGVAFPQYLDEVMARIPQSPDDAFTAALHSLRDSWVAKHERIRAIGNDKDKIAEELTSIKGPRLADPLTEVDIVDITLTPIELVVALTSDAFGRYVGRARGSVGGLHIEDSPFTIVPPHASAVTLRHESTHNITDSFLHYMRPAQSLYGSLDRRFGHYKEQVSDSHFQAPYYVDRMHAEIVTAAFDWEAAGHVSHGEPLPPQTTPEDIGKKFNTYTSELSTAGRDMRDGIDSIDEMLKDGFPMPDKPEKSTLMIPLRLGLMREFVTVGEVIEYDLALARRISEQAGEEAELLLALVPPSKYRHIRSWLEEKYSERLEHEEPLMMIERFSNPPELGNALRRIGDRPLPIESQQAIEKNLTWLADESVPAHMLEACRTFHSDLRQLAKRCPEVSIDQIEKVERRAYQYFFAGLIIEDATEDSSHLSEILANITEEEQEILTAAIRRMLSSGEIYRITPRESLKKSPFSQTLTILGITELPEEPIEEVEGF